MSKNLIYVGVDVDDNSFHFTAYFPKTGEVLESKSRPTAKGLISKMEGIKKKFSDHSLKICYEASYLGHSLQRELVAPSSIPRVHGNNVKTDRVDAGKLAQFYAAGILTEVAAPGLEIEMARDLMRTRQYILLQLNELRRHIHSLLRRNGIHYKSDSPSATHWASHHKCWLERTIESLDGPLKINLKLLYQQMKWLEHTKFEYDKATDELAESDQYKTQAQAQALTCYHGVKNVFAMVMITEIGTIKRFAHPNQLASWMGLDIREYSSGGKHNRFGITKSGNRYLRTAFIEANQKLPHANMIGKELRTRRKKADPKFIHIAERCRERIAKKGRRLYHAGKHPNKIKVACAREMVGFVWESLNAVSA
ncbi:MAG: IS110 family transposase [Bdellovibrio sp.]|nr:IS110 family transposase [Bdellovibrio sp.]